MSKEKAVRDAARALKTAIAEAEAEGFRVDWPARAADLDAIGISETGKVKAVPAASEPAAVAGTRRGPRSEGQA